MGVLYGVYLLVMILEFGSLVFGIHFLALTFGFLGVVFGVSAHSNLGAILGTLQSRPIWHGPLMPVYFIASAFLSGAAALLLFTFIAYWLKGKEMEPNVSSAIKTMAKIFVLFIFVLIFIDMWKIIIGLYGRVTGHYESEMALLTGPLSFNFWFFEIFLGLVFPLILILFTWFKSKKAMFLASLSCIIGIFFMRYDLLIVGQILPLWYYVGATQAKHYLSYFPSFYEFVITFGGIGFCMALYLFVERFIGLDEDVL
jgi:molybdopterin-containing oxidoreductase family membrane subunit